MWDTIALVTVLTLKSDPECPLFKGAAQSVRPQVSTDLGYCNFFNPFYNLNCSAWARVPWQRVTEKSHFPTLNVGLYGNGNRTRATCVVGSVPRRSAIHYAYLIMIHVYLLLSRSISFWLYITNYKILPSSCCCNCLHPNDRGSYINRRTHQVS
jgi:hypothetical protein